jgi:hypothetical protein
MNRKALVLLYGVLLLICGCTSYTSTVLNRLGDNSYFGNSNGEPQCNETTRPYKGYPITLQVPSHLDVYIDETYYLQQAQVSGKPVANAFEEAQIPPLRSVRSVPVTSKKVFFVDYKRPASGVLDVTTTFNSDQYIKTIDSKLQDTTIQDVGDLAGTIAAFAQKRATAIQTAGQAGQLDGIDVLKQARVVAYRRFDINEPDFEEQVDAFVQLHLTNCCPAR